MYTKYKQLHLPYKHNLQTQTNSNTYFIGTTLFWVLFLHSVAIFLFSLSAGWRSSKLLICVCFRDPSHPAWSSSKIWSVYAFEIQVIQHEVHLKYYDVQVHEIQAIMKLWYFKLYNELRTKLQESLKPTTVIT